VVITEPPTLEPITASPQVHPPLLQRALSQTKSVYALIAADYRRSILLSVMVAVWTVELFFVQYTTLIPPQEVTRKFAIFAPVFRLALDLGLITVLVLVLNRRLLSVVACLAFALHIALLTYYHYFHRPLSVLTLRHNWREGAEASSVGLQVVPTWVWFWVSAALVAKLLLIWLARGPRLPRLVRFKLAASVATAYIALTILCIYLDPLYKILSTRGVARLGVIRGYTQTWLAEEYYLGSDEIRKRAIEERQFKSDKLTPLEVSFAPGNKIVMIQAESLDFPIIDYRVDGKEVTPFLNRLAKESIYFRMQAMHFNGSADADFSALNGVRPSRHVLNYNIPEYPYTDTFPQFLKSYGYHTVAFHGNTGDFYKRRKAYTKIGFDELMFKEELLDRFGLQSKSQFGVLDDELLDLARSQLDEHDGPLFHFLITVTSHTPFNLLPSDREELFPGGSGIGPGYFNSMRYLDDSLEKYIESLPDGTTVVIYGDHAAGVDWNDYHSDRDTRRDYVPCFIYKQGSNLGAQQRTRGERIALDGSLTLLDLVAYLRAQIQAERGG
jgi:phosphoglycerol transferase MdoB-like AlkP superfamily enzyme